MIEALQSLEFFAEMSRSDRNAVRSYLTVLLQHLLSLDRARGTLLQHNRRKWGLEVAEYRRRLLGLIAKHGGLKPELRNLDLAGVYSEARKVVSKKFQGRGLDLPDVCPYSLEQAVGAEVWRKLSE